MAMTVELPAWTRPMRSRRRAVRPLRRWLRPALGLLLPVGVALIWEFVVRQGWSTGRLVPPPSMYATIVGLARAANCPHVAATLSRVAAGFGLGVVAGTLLGAVSGYSGLARRLLDPSLQACARSPRSLGCRCSSCGSAFSRRPRSC